MLRRIVPGLAAAACVLGMLSTSGADPAERLSTTADRQSINLTIYNGATSLVHDRRKIVLDTGANHIAWRDVSAQLDATSAVVDDVSAPSGTFVREQNFNFDLLKPATLVDKYVGKEVTVVHDVPALGRPASEKATILANNDGIVLRYADRIETGLYASHLVFPSIPENLRDRPTLTLDLDVAKAGAHQLDLAYLTNGLSWRADYVAVVSPDEQKMALHGLVTLTNTTGTSYSNARVQLVAGNVNLTVPAPSPAPYLALGRVSARPQQENFFEYHLYTLPSPTTVANAQTKQVALLSASDVAVRKTLELRGSTTYYTSQSGDLGAKLPVEVFLAFTNKGGDLGVPLPAGVVRVYKNDSAGLSQFVGLDSIAHTPRDETVRLRLGESFDVTANKKQTDFREVAKCTFESAYAIAVANAKDAEQDVLVIEPIPSAWTITNEGAPHQKTSSSSATWTLRVPARKTTTLTYTVRTDGC